MTINLSFLPATAAAFLLMFARLGTMVMLMPGLGERSLPVRTRLVVALALTLIMFPLHRDAYRIDLSSFGPIVGLLVSELAIGFVFGFAARLALAALQVAGAIIAQQLGLGFVVAVDPTQGQQGAVVGSFLALLGVALVFASDLHHVAIGALDNSYRVFAPGVMPVSDDAVTLIARTFEAAFRIGVQLSAPFLLFGLVFNVGLGLLARLMPQLQVFFLAMPLTILGGLAILLVLIGAMMNLFLDHLGGVLGMLAGR